MILNKEKVTWANEDFVKHRIYLYNLYSAPNGKINREPLLYSMVFNVGKGRLLLEKL